MDRYEKDERIETADAGLENDKKENPVPMVTEEEIYEADMEARREMLDRCRERIEKFPERLEYLAGAIGFATGMGDEDSARDSYDRLRGAPCKRWPSHAYGAAIDFLMLHPEQNAKEITAVIQEGKKYLVSDEIFIKEYEYYRCIGEPDKGIDALKKAVSTLKNASNAALFLLSLHLERGEYDEAVSVGEYALATSGIDNPKDIARACFQTLLARDARFQMAMNSGERISGDHENTLLMIDEMYEYLIGNFSSHLSDRDIELAKIKKEVLKFHKIRLDI